MDHEKLSKIFFQSSVAEIMKEYDKNYFSKDVESEVQSDIVSSLIATLPENSIVKLKWLITATMIDTASTLLNIIDNNDSNTIGSMFKVQFDGEDITGQLQDLFLGEAETHFPEYFLS